MTHQVLEKITQEIAVWTGFISSILTLIKVLYEYKKTLFGQKQGRKKTMKKKKSK